MAAHLRSESGLTARLHAVALANAAAVVAAATFTVCRLVALLAPDALRSLAQSWFHGVAFAPAGFGMGPVEFLVGLVTFSGFVWLGTVAVAALYNAWSRR